MLVAAVLLLIAATPARATFGVTDANFSAEVLDASDQPVTQAGAHPYVGITAFTFNTAPPFNTPDGNVKNIRVDLPPGLISNPQATVQCDDSQYPSCPPESQLGTEEITVVALIGLAQTTFKVPIYNMKPGSGEVSDFAFAIPILAPRTDIVGGVRDTTDAGLFFTITNVANTAPISSILSSKLTFWGVPSAAGHDAERGQSCLPICTGGGTAVTQTNRPFLSLPTQCAGPQRTTLTIDSWEGAHDTAKNDTPVGASDCQDVPFDPSISVTPGTTQADAPTSAAVDLHVPQSSDAGTLATAHVKDVSVTLPPGMTIYPAAANGLGSCSDAQFAATHGPIASELARHGDDHVAAAAGPLTGGIFLGPTRPSRPLPARSSADSLTLEADGQRASRSEAGPADGDLHRHPAAAVQQLHLHFFGGPLAPLANPRRAARATTTTSTPVTGSSADPAPTASPSSSFTVDADGAGGACPADPPVRPRLRRRHPQEPIAGRSRRSRSRRRDRPPAVPVRAPRWPPPASWACSPRPAVPGDDASNGTCPGEPRIGTSSVNPAPGRGRSRCRPGLPGRPVQGRAVQPVDRVPARTPARSTSAWSSCARRSTSTPATRI